MYYGEVKLVSEPFMDKDIDKNGEIRNVAVFPIKPISRINKIHALNEKIDKIMHKSNKYIYRNKSKKVLIKKFNKYSYNFNKNVSKRIVNKVSYYKNPLIKELALKFSNGVCQLCNKNTPFVVDGKPFLEVHHIKITNQDSIVHFMQIEIAIYI